MLETMALHAAAMLEASGEADTIGERLARYYIALFERASLAWETMSDGDWWALYGGEIDNIRAALDWALAEPGRARIAVALAGASARVWERSSLLSEGRKYADRALACLGDDTPPEESAQLLHAAAALWRSADRRRAIDMVERSASVYRALGNTVKLGAVLGALGGSYVYVGRHAAAAAILSEAKSLLEGSKRTKSLSNVINDLGALALITGDLNEARRSFAAGRSFARLLSDGLREYIALINLGEVEFQMGAADRAIACAQEAANSFRSANHRSFLLPALVNLASYQLIGGDSAAAKRAAAEALSLAQEERGRWLRICLQVFALFAARDGRYMDAAYLKGFVDAGYVASGEIRETTEQRIYAELSALLTAGAAPEDVQLWAEDAAGWSEQGACEFVSRQPLTETAEIRSGHKIFLRSVVTTTEGC
jgi:tetratricopeptide (TPR) repeat protein